MKRLILICILFLMGQSVYSLEVVYPKNSKVKINAKSTFFIGNSKEPLTINDVSVPVVEDGGFAHVVPLGYGVNTFTLKSGDETLIYEITRVKQPVMAKAPVFVKEFFEAPYTVVKDNATLRSTPVNDGINRLSQLSEGTMLIIDGMQGSFYRVKLSDREYGWILQNEVEEVCNYEFLPKVKVLRVQKDREYYYYRVRVSEKIPFEVLNQNENVHLKFYGTDIDVDIPNRYGYDYYYEDDVFVLKIRHSLPKRPVITIDAGHGGVELGAIGCCGDREKDINLKIAKYLQRELKNEYKVVMTREDDSRVSLPKRVDIAKEENSTILVSIHANALPDGQDPNKNRGTSVYYYHKQAEPLAQSILKELTEQAETCDDKVRQRSFALVRPTQSVSVLVEVAYMINPYDNMMLTDSDFQKRAAKAIADGIRNYLDSW